MLDTEKIIVCTKQKTRKVEGHETRKARRLESSQITTKSVSM